MYAKLCSLTPQKRLKSYFRKHFSKSFSQMMLKMTHLFLKTVVFQTFHGVRCFHEGIKMSPIHHSAPQHRRGPFYQGGLGGDDTILVAWQLSLEAVMASGMYLQVGISRSIWRQPVGGTLSYRERHLNASCHVAINKSRQVFLFLFLSVPPIMESPPWCLPPLLTPSGTLGHNATIPFVGKARCANTLVCFKPFVGCHVIVPILICANRKLGGVQSFLWMPPDIPPISAEEVKATEGEQGGDTTPRSTGPNAEFPGTSEVPANGTKVAKTCQTCAEGPEADVSGSDAADEENVSGWNGHPGLRGFVSKA